MISVHTAQIIHLLRYRFQTYLPNLEIHTNGRVYYNFNKSDTFTKQGYYEYGVTLLVTYMICASLSFLGNGTVIHQALWSMESKSTTHSTQTTLHNLCECTKKKISADFIYFSYRCCHFFQPILFRSIDDLCEIYDINYG